MHVGQSVAFGSWPSTVALSVRPLEWTVARIFPDGTALLLAKQLVECREYHRAPKAVSWAASDLRAWLNDAFLQSAFSDAERAAIVVRENAGQGMDPSSVDAVFCLASYEAQQLFDSGVPARAYCSSYARDRGGISWWWLAGESHEKGLNADVSFAGEIRHDATLVDYERMGVRPAVVVDLEKIPGWSGAANISSADASNKGAAANGPAASEAPPLSPAPTSTPLLLTASAVDGLVEPRSYDSAAEAAYAADARALLAFFKAGEGFVERAQVKRALQGGYATLCCLERVGFMDVRSAELLLAFVRKQPRLACAIVRNTDLDEFSPKLDLLLALVKDGFLQELCLLEEREGYFTSENLARAIDAAHDAGQLEIVAYLLERRHDADEAPAGFYDEDGAFNLSFGALSLEL